MPQMPSKDPTPSEHELRAVIARTLEVPVERVTRDADLLADLSADSLSLAQLAAELEEKTGYVIPADRLPDVATVGDLYELLDQLPR